MASFQRHLERVRAHIAEIGVDALRDKLDAGDDLVLVDIREREEWDAGFIPGARLLGRGHLESRIGDVVKRDEQEIVLYCAGGVRSAFAAQSLENMGYVNVKSMAGGFSAWVQSGNPTATRTALSSRQLARYDRHLRMPEVGEEGQVKLLGAKVLLIGAGGLGSPAAMYLAAAGVGTLGIVDDDVVDMSNLQRQLLHSEDRVGMAKVDSAEIAIKGINSEIRVQKHGLRVDSANILELLAPYDVVVDGTDNFPTRYLINDACFMLGKTNVHGSIFRFDGQVTVFRPGAGPCYRCLFPQPPPPGSSPSCAEAGVLGVLPGIIGAAQAIEAIKLILGVGQPLVGRLLTFDALQMSFRPLNIRRDPSCPLCGDNPTVTELMDIEQTCTAPVTRNKGASGSPLGPKSVVFVPHPKASPPVAAGVRRSPAADELPVSSGPVRAAGEQLI